MKAFAAAAKAAKEAGIVPLWARLGDIKAPTLIAWGCDDRVCSVDMALLPMR